jgi:hypothetical protein
MREGWIVNRSLLYGRQFDLLRQARKSPSTLDHRHNCSDRVDSSIHEKIQIGSEQL